MKKLQNNFTTPEQSKRLLELGVPADSADLYWHPKYRKNEKGAEYWNRPIILQDGHTIGYEQCYSAYYDLLPCWSVGRLIEICSRCSTLEQRQVLFFCNGDDDYYDFMDYTINVLETEIMTNHMDFSKLEK